MAYEELKAKVRKLANERGCLILAHNYQRPEIQDVADFVGDSLDLARKAMKADSKCILFCGVDFMAETASILNPGKKVIVPTLGARCPMAAQLPKHVLIEAKKAHPDAAVVLYVNTSADAKTEADVVCTSANAVEIASSLPQKEILFGPDENLAWFVAQRVKGKKIIPVPANGYCVTHRLITKELVENLKLAHPKAIVMAHPECNPDVQKLADYLLSTNGMVAKAKELPDKEFIIGTEKGLVYRLQKEIPGKKFYEIPGAVCQNMRKNTLEDAYLALENMGPVMEVPPHIAERARRPIERMLEISEAKK